MRIAIPLALLLFLPAFGAQAAPAAWHSLPQGSHLGFTAKWEGTPVPGEFPQFTVAARLDPAHPAGGRLTVKIATAGVKTQSPDVTRALRGKDWFDVKHYPQATFASHAITRQTGGAIEVTGTLTLKGHSQTFSFPLTLARKGNRLTLDGQLTLQRTDFGIGTGQWAKGGVIAIPVTVAFHVVMGTG